MNKKVRNALTGVVAILVGLFAVEMDLHAQEDDDQARSRARVLVAPLQAGPDVDNGFGEDIADKVRDRVREFQLLTSVDEDEVDDMLDQFDLDWEDLDLVQWRQVASQIDAQLIIWGQIERGGSAEGYQIEPVFVDASEGEEMPVPNFTLNDDDEDEAADRIAEALDRQVSFIRARINCQDYLSGEQYQNALRNCDEAVDINPESGQARFLRGQVYMEMEEWSDAREDLRVAYEAETSNQDAIQNLAFVNAQLDDMDRAIELYREYLQFNPDDEDVRLSVAFNLAQAGGNEEAVEVLREGVERDSTSAELWRYMGDVALRAGLEGDREQVEPGASGSPPAEGNGTAIADTASIEIALDAYQNFIDLSPEGEIDNSIFRNLINANLQLENLERAAEISRAAIERSPGEADMWSLRADIFARQDQFGEAIAAMDSAVARDDATANRYFKRGVFQARAGDVSAALTDFEEAVDRGTPSDRIADQLFGRGYENHFQEENYGEALDLFTTALEFAEEEQSANQIHFWTAVAHYREGERIDNANQEAEECAPAQEAVEHFEQVIPHLDQAGDYQPEAQQQFREGVDVYIYRQNQIVRAAC